MRLVARAAAAVLLAGMAVTWPGMADAAGRGPGEVFVSPHGSDGAAGTPWSPVRSLERARQLARSKGGHVTVRLAPGVYRMTQPLKLDSGDSGVVWQGSGQSVISGGLRVEGWRQVPGRAGLWSAPAPAGLTDTRQLYVNGVRASRTRGAVPVTLTATGTGYTASADTMSRWRDPSSIEFVYTGGQSFWSAKSYGLGAWTEPRCPIGSVSGTTVTMAQPCWDNSTRRAVFPNIPGRTVNMVGPAKLTSGELPAYVENAYELLGTPGQWYLDKAARTFYYTPRPGEDLRHADVEAPVLEKLIDAQGVHDFAFRNVQFSYATWMTPSTPEGFSEIQAGYTITGPNGYAAQGLCQFVAGGTCPYGSWTPEPANVSVTSGDRVEFTGDVFAHLGAAGLGLVGGTKDSLVKGDLFTDISGNGIELGGVDKPEPTSDSDITRDNTVADNHLYGLPREYHGGVAILNGYTQRDTITHNQIDEVSYSAISMGWGGWPDKIKVAATPNISHDNAVTDNLIHDHMRLLDDGAAIYTQGITGSSLTDGEKVTGNVVHDQYGIGKLIYTDNGCTYETIQGNVIYHGAYFNVGTPHVDYRDSLHNLDPTLIADNYWEQGDPDSVNKGVVTQGNHILSSPAAAPQTIVSAAGLEPPYRGLLHERVGGFAAPDAPERISVFAAGGKVYAAWNPSFVVNGFPVQSYTVTASDGTHQRSVTESAADFARTAYAVVDGLTDGTPYTVTVTARNHLGTSAPSLPSAAVTPGPGGGKLPAAPANPFAYPASDAVSLHWTPPADTGDTPVIGYLITVSDGRQPVAVTGRDVLIGRPMTRVIAGLKPATAYTLTIAAITATGTGPAASLSVTTTP